MRFLWGAIPLPKATDQTHERMSREFPDAFADPLLEPNRSCEGADAPEDQEFYRGTSVTGGHKSLQLFQGIAVIILLCGFLASSFLE